MYDLQKSIEMAGGQRHFIRTDGYQTDHPDEASLRKYRAMSGLPLKRFFNTSGLPYREMGLSQKLPGMSEEEQFALLADACEKAAGGGGQLCSDRV